jgi:cysteine synthase A
MRRGTASGNTSMVRLRSVVPPGCAAIWAKLEWENPTGSVKDRMALAVISRAEADGRLLPGDTVVEYTGGTTGASLALVCAAKGYPIRIVSSDPFAREKLDQMAALGAQLTFVPSEGGMTTKKLILDMIEAAREISREPHSYWTDQVNNHDSIAGYYPLADGIEAVSTGDAKEMTRRLAREEGLIAGTSAGANVVAAIRVAERLGPEATVVTLMADSGLKYMNTDVYQQG